VTDEAGRSAAAHQEYDAENPSLTFTSDCSALSLCRTSARFFTDLQSMFRGLSGAICGWRWRAAAANLRRNCLGDPCSLRCSRSTSSFSPIARMIS